MFDSSTTVLTLVDGLATGGKNGNSLYSSVGIDRADLDNLGSDFFSVFRGNYTPRVVSNTSSIVSLGCWAPGP